MDDWSWNKLIILPWAKATLLSKLAKFSPLTNHRHKHGSKTQQGHKSHQIQAEGVIAPLSQVQQLTCLKKIKAYECWGKLERKWNTTMLILPISVWWPDRIRQKSCNQVTKACGMQKNVLFIFVHRGKKQSSYCMTKPSISIVNGSICSDPWATRYKDATYEAQKCFLWYH